MTSDFARIEVRDVAGVFGARQLGREVAAELRLDRQDQVRVATALSEVARGAVVTAQTAAVAFSANESHLIITVKFDSEVPAEGTRAASRLMDDATAAGPVLRMLKRRPANLVDLPSVTRRLAALFPPSPLDQLDELRRNNEDLIRALDDLRQQKEQLVLVNAELEETNQGVMAMYSQLSDELEQTNRGVVALYAELDEKSERLREASEAKNRFWANISHELRTPLNSIIGLTRLLADPGAGSLDPEQLHQVDLIQNAGRTLLALVNDLLDVAKAESGRLRIDPATVALPALLGRLRGLVRPMAEGRPIEVIVSDEGAPDSVLTDELALTAILRNLLANGIKYTNSGEVRLNVRTAGPRLEIVVADTGIGIPAGQQERVFEEFFQVPGVRRGGTGLGLSYARRLAGLLGGDLTLTSEPGAGTTVVLSLPHGPAEVGTVLIADDDPGFRQVLRALLAGIADRVIETEDGDRALAAATKDNVDLVVTDLRMPGVDGAALLRQLPAAMPAIVITGVDVEPPPRAAALLHKDELTRDRLAFAIRNACRETS
jgi:signal transduction histidine kinase/CheY-like chemotaxis protein